MPFIPHTEKDTREMLEAIGADSIEDLFDEIPAKLRIDHLHGVLPEFLRTALFQKIFLHLLPSRSL